MWPAYLFGAVLSAVSVSVLSKIDDRPRAATARRGHRVHYCPSAWELFCALFPCLRIDDRRRWRRQSAAVDGALMVDSPAVRAPMRQRA